MPTGLIFGDFDPLHYGHEALLKFGAGLCHKLIVGVGYGGNEVYSFEKRVSWVQKAVDRPVSIYYVQNVKDVKKDDQGTIVDSQYWSYIRMLFQFERIDYVIGSEPYITRAAQELFAKPVFFDPKRRAYRVSSSLIRKDLTFLFDFLPPYVKEDVTVKVCFCGPEGAGKTTLASNYYHNLPELVAESGLYKTKEELLLSSRLQESQFRHLCRNNLTGLAVCDTDPFTTNVLAPYYVNNWEPIEVEVEKDAYILLQPTNWGFGENDRRLTKEQRIEVYCKLFNQIPRGKLHLCEGKREAQAVISELVFKRDQKLRERVK